jgi:hypothetical protein
MPFLRPIWVRVFPHKHPVILAYQIPVSLIPLCVLLGMYALTKFKNTLGLWQSKPALRYDIWWWNFARTKLLFKIQQHKIHSPVGCSISEHEKPLTKAIIMSFLLITRMCFSCQKEAKFAKLV